MVVIGAVSQRGRELHDEGTGVSHVAVHRDDTRRVARRDGAVVDEVRVSERRTDDGLTTQSATRADSDGARDSNDIRTGRTEDDVGARLQAKTAREGTRDGQDARGSSRCAQDVQHTSAGGGEP